MAPAVVRTLTIVYEADGGAPPGITVGGGTDYEIDGQVSLNVGWINSSVDFTVMVSADQAAVDPDIDFATKCDALETAFRTPWLDLTVSQGAATLIDFKHSTNTGFRADPSVVKREDIGNTGYSRRYTVTIPVEMPADVSNTSGRQDADIKISYLPSRRRQVEISGVYTALPPGGVTARQQYEASINAFAATVLGPLGGTWELAEEPVVNEDHVQKVVNFVRVYDELIFEQAGGSPDEVSIVRQRLVISRAQVGPGDSPTGDTSFEASNASAASKGRSGGYQQVGLGGGETTYPTIGKGNTYAAGIGGSGGGSLAGTSGAVNRLLEIEASYECWIDKTVTPPTTLESFYSTIQSFIVQQIKTILKVSSVAITSERPSFDLDDCRITSSISAVASSSSGLVEYSQEVEDVSDPGIVLVPAWTGNSLSKFMYQGPQTIKQTITEKALYMGSDGFDTASPRPVIGQPAGEGGVSAERILRVRRRPIRMGVGSNTINLMDCTRITEREFYVEVAPRVQVTST